MTKHQGLATLGRRTLPFNSATTSAVVSSYSRIIGCTLRLGKADETVRENDNGGLSTCIERKHPGLRVVRQSAPEGADDQCSMLIHLKGITYAVKIPSLPGVWDLSHALLKGLEMLY
ncbi:hypothetical protein AVEN_99753-1 [Araneus ventricosus]|uniref:Uncharacterized protein n=1 Tax=Araneus ventricosus TaxID=182803 RepID=A0A4Y2DJ87_ARAVE|nr:hypothetical protein AVEN_99753-1 [Araneus ventricosus]